MEARFVVCAGAVMNIILGFILALVLSAQQPAFASNRISVFADSGSALQDARRTSRRPVLFY